MKDRTLGAKEKLLRIKKSVVAFLAYRGFSMFLPRGSSMEKREQSCHLLDKKRVLL
jgi:hypothetical protein